MARTYFPTLAEISVSNYAADDLRDRTLTGRTITSEAVTPPASANSASKYQVQLEFIPTVGTLVVTRTSGSVVLTQVAATATPGADEVAVDWVTGILTFPSSAASVAHTATYSTFGSLAGALLLNRIQRRGDWLNSFKATRTHVPLGTDAVFVGAAGNATATGPYSVAIGLDAGLSLTSAEQVVFIGWQAGRNATTGIANVLVGESAGYYITTGFDNVGVGSDVFCDGTLAAGLTTGSHNTAMGNNAGQTVIFTAPSTYTNTTQTGSHNSAFGQNSVWGAVGNYQTAIGSGSRTNRIEQVVLGRIEGYDEILCPGSITMVPTDQTISAAGTTINSDRSVTRITTASNYTLTSVPTIATGFDGQVLTIINSSTSVIVLADNSSLSGSTLRLGVSTIALGQDESITLQFSTGRGWVRIAGGVGTMASQDANAVAITGGTISTTGTLWTWQRAGVGSLVTGFATNTAGLLQDTSPGGVALVPVVVPVGTIISGIGLRCSCTGEEAGFNVRLMASQNDGSGLFVGVTEMQVNEGSGLESEQTATLSSPVTTTTGKSYWLQVTANGSGSEFYLSDVGFATTTRPQ
jgi:hypothetical protein